jgi:ATP-dependent DNA ligase
MRVLMSSNDIMERSASDIIANGGEGVVLRRSSSLYEHGRSLGVLKIKVEYFKMLL